MSSPGFEPGALDRQHQRIERVLVARERGPPAAFVRDALQEAALGHDPAGGVIDLGGRLERVGEAFRARRDDHEVLDVDPPSCMRAAAEDLDFGQRDQAPGRRRGDSAKAAVFGSLPPRGERQAKPRSRALPPSLARVSVPSSATSLSSIASLIKGIGAEQGPARSQSRIPARASCTSRPPSRCPAVAFLDRFAAAARGARGSHSAVRRRRRSSATSASIVGRPREIPDAARDQGLNDRIAHDGAPPGVRRLPPARVGGSAISGAAHRRTASRSRSSGQIFDRRFAVERARNSAGRSEAARASFALGSSQSTPRDRRRRAPRSAERERSCRDPTRAPFRRRWLRQNARSKAGSPNHAHSASRKDRTPAGPRGCSSGSRRHGRARAATRQRPVRERHKTGGERWMRARRRAQVGLDPDRFERRVVREV